LGEIENETKASFIKVLLEKTRAATTYSPAANLANAKISSESGTDTMGELK
jgi:hypothetical protein